MSIYKIPLKFRAGEFKFTELSIGGENESLDLDYDTEYQIITYDVPMYGNETRIYTVPREQMPNGLIAIYNDGGELDQVTLVEKEHTRLIYRYFKNINASKKGVLEFVHGQADQMCARIMDRKQKLARLFFGKFYDGEAVEIAAVTATTEEMKAVIDKYGPKTTAIDNSGDYPPENMVMLDDETLGVMLMCTNGNFRSMLFDLAATTVEERIKSLIPGKIDKTDDFKYISEEWD